MYSSLNLVIPSLSYLEDPCPDETFCGTGAVESLPSGRIASGRDLPRRIRNADPRKEQGASPTPERPICPRTLRAALSTWHANRHGIVTRVPAANSTVAAARAGTKPLERPAITWIFCPPTGGNREAPTISSAPAGETGRGCERGPVPGSGTKPRTPRRPFEMSRFPDQPLAPQERTG